MMITLETSPHVKKNLLALNRSEIAIRYHAGATETAASTRAAIYFERGSLSLHQLQGGRKPNQVARWGRGNEGSGVQALTWTWRVS